MNRYLIEYEVNSLYRTSNIIYAKDIFDALHQLVVLTKEVKIEVTNVTRLVLTSTSDIITKTI